MNNLSSIIKRINIENIEDSDIFRSIVEHSPNGIVVADKNLIIKLFNTVAEEYCGIKSENAMGFYFHHIFPQVAPFDIDAGNNYEQEISIIDLNDKKLQTKYFAIKNQSGVVAVIFLLQDLTDVLKLMVDLKDRQHLIDELQDVIEGSFDGMLVTDGEGNVLMINKSYERVTSLTKDEIMGKNMKDLINPVWMKNSVVFPVIKEKRPVSMPHLTRHKKNIIVTGTPVFDKSGNVKMVIVNARDISEIYELREELVKVREMEKLYFKNLNDNSQKLCSNNNIVIVSDSIQEIFLLAHRVSNFDASVLLLGESGVGKEEVAKYIHNNSLRKDKPFVVINCGAIPEHLLESELFGYEKGAFTGALREGKKGLFEMAEGGTLFLDEIGEMPYNLQVKLLRVLESKDICHLGSVKPIHIDVRVVAATNKDLATMVENREFREDLFYRLNVIQVKVPALRERKQDVAPLALHFLTFFNNKYGQSKKLTYDVIKEMEDYPWPGNIRQLKNMLENMVIVSNNEYLQVNDLPWKKGEEKNEAQSPAESIDSDIMPLEQAIEHTERLLLQKAKDKYKSTRKIALALQVDQSTIARKMKKYGLSPVSDEEMPN